MRRLPDDEVTTPSGRKARTGDEMSRRPREYDGPTSQEIFPYFDGRLRHHAFPRGAVVPVLQRQRKNRYSLIPALGHPVT